MDPDINFKRDFPLLDKIIHWVAPFLVGYIIFAVVNYIQGFIMMIFGIPPVQFSPQAINSFPPLTLFNPMWIPPIFVAVVVLVYNKRRESIKLNRFKNRNVPTMFYDETPVAQPKVEQVEESTNEDGQAE